VTRIAWGSTGSRFYENGVDRGVLYVGEADGVPWNGLTSITENVSGGAAKPYYIDGEKYLNTATREEYTATLTAYTYPDEFEPCDGITQVRSGFKATNQRRQSFGLTYRTMIGNDLTPTAGYKIHIIYNVLASPAQHAYKSISTAQDPDDFSWTLTSLPPVMLGYKRTSHFIVDSRDIDSDTLSGIEDILYGTDSTSPRLPDVAEILDLIDTGDHLTVTDNGDGTFTMSAPIADLVMLDIGNFQITWDTVVDNGDGTYTATSS
jgi:hypothetical protein